MLEVDLNRKDFEDADLEPVFASNGWRINTVEVRESLANSECVVSAWINGELVGFVNALSDSGLTVYIHYVIVSSDHHGKGIGTRLVTSLVSSFPNFKHIVLATHNDNLGFFERLGFFSSDEMRVVELRRKP